MLKINKVIVNFDHVLHLVSVSIADFEIVNIS